jgi:O-antigen ligase
MANEDLDLAQAGYLNHAHNDYLELIVEAGLPGAIVLFVIIMVIAWRMLAVARDRARDRGPALAGFAMLALLAAHSLVDYPVRSDAIAAVAGVAIGLLFVPLSRKNHGSSRKRGKRGFSSPGLSGGSPQGRAR